MDRKERDVIAESAIAYLISRRKNLEASLLSRSRLSLEITDWTLAWPISGEGEICICDYSAVLLVPPDQLHADRKSLTQTRSKNISDAIKEAMQGSFVGSQTVVRDVHVTVGMDMAVWPIISDTEGNPIIDHAHDFDHSEDYRDIHWRDKDYHLSPLQAEVVAMLHKASTTNTRGLSWEAISGRISGGPSRMSDIFKGTDPRSALVKFQRQGRTYRLNL